MKLAVGVRLRSQVCSTEVVLVRATDPGAELTCGGHPLVAHNAEPTPGLTPEQRTSGGNLVGKRYVDAGGAVEVLVTKPGDGELAVNGEPLQVKSSKALPSSD
jgi:hypothetical protein